MTSRLHRLLWLLTERNSDFVSPALNTNIRYNTAPEDAVTASARDLLQLRRTDTDFYVAGAMAALYSASSIIRGKITDESVIFAPLSLVVPPASTVGAEMRPADGKPIRLVYHPDKIPAAHWWRLRHAGDFTELTSDAGHWFKVDYRLPPGGGIVFDWPDLVDFNVAFDVSSWNEDDEVTLSVEPSSYPFSGVVQQIRDHGGDFIRLMAAKGTLSAFDTSINPLHQLGAFVAAVVLHILDRSPGAMVDDPIEWTPGPDWPPGDGGPGILGPYLTYQGAPLHYSGSQLIYSGPQ